MLSKLSKNYEIENLVWLIKYVKNSIKIKFLILLNVIFINANFWVFTFSDS